jgi:hypothetical protein
MRVLDLIRVLGEMDPGAEVFWVDTLCENQLSRLREEHVRSSRGGKSGVIRDGGDVGNTVVIGQASPGFYPGGGW